MKPGLKLTITTEFHSLISSRDAVLDVARVRADAVSRAVGNDRGCDTAPSMHRRKQHELLLHGQVQYEVGMRGVSLTARKAKKERTTGGIVI